VTSTISSKGQITVPLELRTRLGLRAGTVVEFELQGDRIVLRKGGGAVHPVDQVFGVLALDRPVDEILERTRGPRPKPWRPAVKGRSPR